MGLRSSESIALISPYFSAAAAFKTGDSKLARPPPLAALGDGLFAYDLSAPGVGFDVAMKLLTLGGALALSIST